jgi:hypothetical protein
LDGGVFDLPSRSHVVRIEFSLREGGREVRGGRRRREMRGRVLTLSIEMESMIFTTVEWITSFLSMTMYSGRYLP